MKHYEEARRLKQEQEDPRGLGRTLAALAALLGRRHRYAEAAELYREALVLREQTGDVLGVGHTSLGLGAALMSLSRYDEALVFARRAKLSFAKAGVPNEQGADDLIWAISVKKDRARPDH
jgi:tetratricopeptide (TPR) repeat protein